MTPIRLRDYRPERSIQGCSLAGAYNITEQILDGITVMHAPTGCAAVHLMTRFATAYHRRQKGYGSHTPAVGTVVSTDLREQDIIFGDRERLQNTLETVIDRFSPSLITIITACAAGLIGDNVRGIAAEFESRCNTRILVIESDGVLGGGFYAGADNAYEALLETFARPPARKRDDCVNILGEKNLSTEANASFAEIQRLIGCLGMRIHTRFVRGTTTEQLRQLTEARMNLLRGMDTALWPARYLQDRYGMPFLDQPFPVGHLATVTWIQAFGRLIDRSTEAESLILDEMHALITDLKEIGESIAGKTAIVSGSGNFLWLADLLLHLGMDVVQINAVGEWTPPHPDERGDGLLSASRINPLNGWQEVAEQVQQHQPDFCLSTRAIPISEGTTGAALPIVLPVGFMGVRRLAGEWVRQLRHPFEEGWRHAHA